MNGAVSADDRSPLGSDTTGAAPGPVRTFLHLLVLWSFAAAQPLYSTIADSVPFLLAHRLGTLELIAYTLGLLLLVPLALWVLVVLTGRIWNPLGLLLQRTIIALLATAALFPILDRLGLPEALALLLAFAIGLIPAWQYRGRFWSSLFDLLMPAPLVFAVIFLIFSPVRGLLFDEAVDSAQGTEDDRDVPVVIVMLDEFSTQALLDADGELDRERLPGFARLADVSTWYPRATTVVEATVMAAPVVLSGILPEKDRHGPPVHGNFPENLFDQVAPERRIWAVENGSRLCRPQRCETADIESARGTRLGRWTRLGTDTAILYGHMVLPDALRARWLPELGTRWAGFAGDEDDAPGDTPVDEPRAIRWGQRLAEFDAFYEELERVGPDTLHYLHLLLPHAPWIYLPDGTAYDINRGDSINGMMPDRANDTGVKHMWWNDEWSTVIAEQRFLLQVHYIDMLIGRLVDRLSASEYFDRTMLVVVADHGGSFTPGTSRRALTEDNFAEILPIPMFIKYPGQRSGARSDRPAELVDVSPTVRRALGLDVSGLDGRPLQDEEARPLRPRLINEHGQRFEFTAADYEREFDRILQRMHRRFILNAADRFPLIADWAAAYGRPLSEIGSPGAALDDLTFEWQAAAAWQEVTPDGRFVPARLLGRLRGELPASQGLLITLDDRVAAFTRPFDYPGADGLVEAMIRPELFRKGANRPRVHAVFEEDAGIVLREIPVVTADGAYDDARSDDGAVDAASDDAGREQVADTALLGRWIVPASLGPGEGVELRGSWHSAGGDIRWVGRQGSACFDLDEPAGDLELVFHAIPFLHAPALERQRMQIEVNGRSVAEFSMDEERLRAYRVALEAPRATGGQPLCVRFRFPDSRIPRDLGAGPDRRELGAAFLKFRLIARSAEPTTR